MRKKLRTGIAMLELIFAIVILGIVMMSAPTLISTATTSGYVALQQEAIATAAAEMGMILTHHWDERDTNESNSAPILLTQGDGNLNETIILPAPPLTPLPSGRRPGTPTSSKRTFITSLGGRLSASTVLGSDLGDRDDVDDFMGNSGLINYENTDTLEGDTVDINITIATTVAYISDIPTSSPGTTYNGGGTLLTLNDPFNTAAANPTSSIKHVRIRLTTSNTNEELDKQIVLNAFSCNIGTYELNGRTFP